MRQIKAEGTKDFYLPQRAQSTQRRAIFYIIAHGKSR